MDAGEVSVRSLAVVVCSDGRLSSLALCSSNWVVDMALEMVYVGVKEESIGTKVNVEDLVMSRT